MTTKMISMDFDGKAVQVPDGLTLVDAGATVGVHIPNLCHIKELRGVGACRMCMVEIEGMKTPVTACTTRVKEGMKVATKTPKVEEIRKFVVDLVLSFHPLDCMTCPKAGACDLQRYAADLGIRESSYGRKSFNYELNDRSPLITIDNNYCILCGRCVRVCKEQSTNVLDFMGRGIATKVSTALDRPLHESGCTFCGSCVDACPVNALMERDRWQHGREWDLARTETACTACGSGCSVVVSRKDNKIVKVNAREDNGYLCAIGRFGFDSMLPEHRVTQPMKKQGGKLVPATWDEATKIAADALKKAGANAGFLAAGSLTNEEAFAFQALARDVVGTEHIDTTASLYAAGAISALRKVYGDGGPMIATQADLSSADLVVLAGADPSQVKQSLQEVDVMIRRRAQAGAKVIVINPAKTGIASHPNAIHLALKAGTDAALIGGLLSAAFAEGLTSDHKGVEALKKSLAAVDEAAKVSSVPAEKLAEAGKAFAGAKKAVVLFGTGVSMSESSVLQVLNLALVKSAGVIPIMLEANSLGVMEMGCLPGSGPGFADLKKKGKGAVDMRSGVKALFVAGNAPDTGIKADFLIAAASHLNDTAARADVVLPLSALYEKQGTIVNTYGVTRHLTAAQDPAGEARDGAELFAEISTALSKDKGFAAKTATAGAKKVKSPKLAAGEFQPAAAKAAEAAALSSSALLKAMNKGMLAGSRVAPVLTVKVPVLQR